MWKIKNIIKANRKAPSEAELWSNFRHLNAATEKMVNMQMPPKIPVMDKTLNHELPVSTFPDDLLKLDPRSA